MLKRFWQLLFPPGWTAIDVDTLRKPDGTPFRIRYIDGLEMDQPWGKEALARLKQLLKMAGRISCKVTGYSYGREVGIVYLQDGAEDLGRILVLEGLATNAKKYGNKYEKEEAEAKKHKRGMWGTGTKHVDPEVWRKSKK